jgi:hypothetical protein
MCADIPCFSELPKGTFALEQLSTATQLNFISTLVALSITYNWTAAVFALVQSQLNFDATYCSVEQLEELLSTDTASHSVTSLDGCLLTCGHRPLQYERWYRI